MLEWILTAIAALCLVGSMTLMIVQRRREKRRLSEENIYLDGLIKRNVQ